MSISGWSMGSGGIRPASSRPAFDRWEKPLPGAMPLHGPLTQPEKLLCRHPHHEVTH